MAAAPTASAPLPKQHLVFLRVVSVKAFVFSPGRGIFHRNNLYKLFMFVSSRGSGRGGELSAPCIHRDAQLTVLMWASYIIPFLHIRGHPDLSCLCCLLGPERTAQSKNIHPQCLQWFWQPLKRWNFSGCLICCKQSKSIQQCKNPY